MRTPPDRNHIYAVTQALAELSRLAKDYTDSFDSFTATGSGTSTIYDKLLRLIELTACNGIEIDLVGEAADQDALLRALADSDFEDWRVICNKRLAFMQTDDSSENLMVSSFCTLGGLESWLLSLNPFSPQCVLHMYHQVVVYTNGVTAIWQSRTLSIAGFEGLDIAEPFASDEFPQHDDVVLHLHIQATQAAKFAPSCFIPMHTVAGSTHATILQWHAARVLSACLVSIIDLTTMKVAVKGIRCVEGRLPDSCPADWRADGIQSLQTLVRWAYEEKVETRLKLVRDRLSLDSTHSDDFVAFCLQHANATLTSCKEQYQYVLSDIRHEFEKGKRDFLDDLRKMADTYRARLHDLHKGVARDFLAVLGIFVLGTAPKLLETEPPHSIRVLPILGVLLGSYAIVSGTVQLVLGIIESKEMKRLTALWGKDTRTYLNLNDTEKYIKSYMSLPRRIFHWALGLGTAAYFLLGVGLCCSNYVVMHFVRSVSYAQITEDLPQVAVRSIAAPVTDSSFAVSITNSTSPRSAPCLMQ